jgi:hypothetical protein
MIAVTAWLLSTGRQLLYVSFVTSLKSNSCTALTTLYTTQKSFFNLHALNNSALQPKSFLTGLITSNGRSAIPSANHSQGLLQNSQSLPALDRRKGEPQSQSGKIPAPAATKPEFRMSSSWPGDYAFWDTSTQNVARINGQLGQVCNL